MEEEYIGAPRFEELTIDLPRPLGGVESLSCVVGTPEWWPTGARVAVAIAHDDSDLNDPMVVALHEHLAGRKFCTLRFNFPFAEVGRKDQDEPEILEKAYRAAISVLGRDPLAAPSHLFLGGKGLGGKVATGLATSGLQIAGLFLLGYPLHPKDRPDAARPEAFYRMVPPMLFVQGDNDPHCELTALRRSLSRVGAPTTLRIVSGADESLIPKKDALVSEAVAYDSVAQVVAGWIERILDLP